MNLNIVKLRAWKWFFSKRAIWLLCPILYLMNIQTIVWTDFAKLVLALFLGFFSGVTLNDWLHRKEDKKVGKENGVERGNKVKITGIIISTITACSILAYDLAGIFAVLFPLALIIEGLYSLKLKSKGVFGILTNTTAEFLPFLFVFSFFSHWKVDTVVFSIAYFMLSLTDITNHQLEDMENDEKSGSNTLATSLGNEKTKKIIRWLSILAVYPVFVLYFIFVRFLYFEYLLIAVIFLRLFHTALNPDIRESFEVSLTYVDFVLIGFLNVVPLYFAFLLVNKSLLYIPVLLFSLAVDYNFLKQVVKRVRKWI